MNKINKGIEMSILAFTQSIAEKYSLSQEELVEMWNETTKMKTKTKKMVTTQKKKKTAYQNFSDAERATLKKSNPSITFGELSKQIGAKWKNLTQEKKDQWIISSSTSPSPPPSPVPTPSPPVVNETLVDSVEEEDNTMVSPQKLADMLEDEEGSAMSTKSNPMKKYEDMKLTELQEICEKANLSTKGNKKILVRRILTNNVI